MAFSVQNEFIGNHECYTMVLWFNDVHYAIDFRYIAVQITWNVIYMYWQIDENTRNLSYITSNDSKTVHCDNKSLQNRS